MQKITLLFCLGLSIAAQAENSASLGYRNAVTSPPPGWQGPVFELSDNYPTENPGTCSTQECPWLGLNVNFNQPLNGPPLKWGGIWAEYINSIITYVKQGQDPDLKNATGWIVDPDGQLQWFHVPWMAYDPTRGREFVHGLTNERTASLSDFQRTKLLGKNPLAIGLNRLHIGLNSLPLANQKNSAEFFETWAFGVYNRFGGYALGQSFNKKAEPVIGNYGGVPAPLGLPFPEGTVVAKLLFTTATPKDVPYLKDSPTWQADRHIQKGEQFLCARKVQDVRLVQLDVAVVDSRSPTRWVFGTFAFNGNKKGATAWDKLEPVGLQWGSDPFTFPAVPKTSSIPPSQSVLNTKIGTPQHFGCNGRLAGPVDNKLSSCLSCHGGGYAPPVGFAGTSTTTPPIFGYQGECTNYSLENAQYFNNVSFPMNYTGGQYSNVLSMDTSLQMQVGFMQYGQFKQFGQPVACVDNIGN